jgi:NAD(P)-dependent dehydrogenase (short-subunit alcohol dehydrogenase family)
MKVRTLVARHPGGAITPKNDWRLYAENTMAPLRRKSGGAITPKTKWLLYAGNSQRIASEGGTACYRVTDVKRREDVSQLVELAVKQHGKLDVLLSNAGIAPISLLDELRVED